MAKPSPTSSHEVLLQSASSRGETVRWLLTMPEAFSAGSTGQRCCRGAASFQRNVCQSTRFSPRQGWLVSRPTGRDRLLLPRIVEAAARDEPALANASLSDSVSHSAPREPHGSLEQQQREPVPGALTFPVFSLSQDHVPRSQLGLERLHKLGVDTNPVLS